MKIHSPRARHGRVPTRVAVALVTCSFAFFACSDANQSHPSEHSTPDGGVELDASGDHDGTDASAHPPRNDGGVAHGSDGKEAGSHGPDEFVIFDFDGVVDAVSPLTDALTFPVAVGDRLRGVYAFNPSTAKVATSGGAEKYAFGNLDGKFEFHVDVGTLGVAGAKLDSSFEEASISIGDDVESSTGELTDSYDLEVKQATATGFLGQSIDFSLRLASPKDLGAVRGTALPVNPPDVSRFDDTVFVIHLGGAEVRGHVTDVTRSTSTLLKGVCGDGILHSGEDCDDFNDRDGDGCDSCRFTCVYGDPDRGCDTGDACNGPATCLYSMHVCVPGPEKPNFKPCGDDRVCWEGVCQKVDADPSRFATFSFEAYIDEIHQPVITVPPAGIQYADTINGTFTVDVGATPAAANAMKSEFGYANEPGQFALHAAVGPLTLQASSLGAAAAASSVRITPKEYDVTGGQLVAVGSPVAPARFELALTNSEAAFSPSSPLTLAFTPFDSGTVVLSYGDLVLHANVAAIRHIAGGTARLPAPDAGSDSGAPPSTPPDGGHVVSGKDAGTTPISTLDGGQSGITPAP